MMRNCPGQVLFSCREMFRTAGVLYATSIIVSGLTHPDLMGTKNLRVLRPTLLLARKSDAVVREYYDCWNKRNMTAAANLFTPNCIYEDTLFPVVFEGREKLLKHLCSVADSLPTSFKFVIDKISTDNGGSNIIGVQWHVESDGKALPFTRVYNHLKISICNS